MQSTETTAAIKENGHFIDGKEETGASSELIEVRSPVNGNLIGKVPKGDANIVNNAAISAAEAFTEWSKVPMKERVQVLYRFKQLLEQDIDKVADLVHKENGKTQAEAKAEIEKGIEVVEFAASLPQIMNQELLEVSRGIDCYSRRYPIGVAAAITPFNFPAMVPLWMIPIAIATGNTLIHKPSEQVPLTANVLASYLQKAGLPKGVFNVVHGDKQTVQTIIDNPAIKAIGFVGSSAVAKIVYEKGTMNGKRVLALGGAKNHLIVMPDADPDSTASNIVASAFGCAGQRCMAASVVILVGNSEHILNKIVSEAQKVKAGINLGAVISLEAKIRIENYIERAQKNGANILLDGRHAYVKGMENGTYVNPTIIDGVQPTNECACDEIFGPVLTVIRVNTLEEALLIENRNPYGNAAAIFTTNGGTARYFSDKANAGMVGVNIGVPVPREPFSFGGWNQSRYGYGDITGAEAIRFWTNLKKVTQKWTTNAPKNWMS
ncbi:MAG TPA: CoA-acylating methylmalonate-semialdehyde dehydrogenase [Niabella sp.]|nr:CoA-acylating methylmalonate-semialdehyde dehydrogenase [Niabella sp.]